MYTTDNLKLIRRIFILIAVGTLCSSSVQAAEVIQNVSLQATSDNETKTAILKVKTIVDGQVIEDYEETSTTGDISYQSKSSGDNAVKTMVVGNTGPTDPDTYRTLTELLELLQRLTRLLKGNSLEE